MAQFFFAEIVIFLSKYFGEKQVVGVPDSLNLMKVERAIDVKFHLELQVFEAGILVF